jgi:catechol 2,3-dioxygenase-like lactoylglutathione lyase family enzyme
MEDVVTGLLDQFERGKISRRGLVQGLTAGLAAAAVTSTAPALAAAPAGKSPFKAVGVNHISYVVKDYARTRDFYAELFGMKVTGDDGKQAELSFGNTFLLPRNARDASAPTPLVNHIAYTIETWDKNAVEAELKRRGHQPRVDTEDSFHIKDPDGFDVQISGPKMTAAAK